MITTIEELRRWSQQQHHSQKRVGLVPTMGALHDGHLSLVKTANQYCDTVLVSIFVNPTQFGVNEDFHQYPRLLEDDLRLLQTVGSPEVFVPEITEMYPAGFDVSVHVGGVSQPFEGEIRPTHFDGVATVVLKLFLASGADIAFFGQKDFQQVCVIRKMVTDLNVPVEIVVCPIIREPDGLAMSSRNKYLSKSQRSQAVVLSQSLILAEQMIVGEKIQDAERVRKKIRSKIETAPDMNIDYIAIADPQTLHELTTINCDTVILVAAGIGTSRLIDNILITTTRS
ncbi:MAG: pantoate--beta-alanine ligase [Planctomycetaceae bacterium]|jgi:pantoate--beta-alanine ligase|nr:pantoate--beta-alanine ligase [Planctomycetaceae bacterium]